MKKLFFSLIMLLCFVSFVCAVELVPQGNINGKGIRSIKNFTNISADLFCMDNGTCGSVATMIAAGGGGGGSDGDTQHSGGLPFNYNDSRSVYTNQTALYENMSTDGNLSISSTGKISVLSAMSNWIRTLFTAGSNITIVDGVISSADQFEADTTIANCSETGDCDNIAYMNNTNMGYLHLGASDFRATTNGDFFYNGSGFGKQGFTVNAIPFGVSLLAMDSGDTTNFTSMSGVATMNVTTQYVCDSTKPFKEGHEGMTFLVFSSAPVNYRGATGLISDYVNDSCIRLSVASAGQRMLSDSSSMRYVVFDKPLFMVLDRGSIYARVGDNPDASYKIDIPDGNGFYGVYVDDVVGVDQHQAVTINVDSKDYDGVVGLNLFMMSSTGVEGTTASAISLEGDATGFNNSQLAFISVTTLGEGKDNDVDILQINGEVGHIIHAGQPDIISRAYYDNGAGDTIDATGNFTSQSDDIALFENDNSYIYIGNELNFTNVGISLSTEGTRLIYPEYYYCANNGSYGRLSGVVDTTNDFKISGTISFENPSDRGKCNIEYDGTAFENTTEFSYIAIKRTRNNYATQKPVESLISISGGNLLYLDKYGLKPIGSAGAPYTCEQNRAGMWYYDTSAVALLWCDGANWNEFAETADITIHNNLGGLQGGKATEYYHLEAGEHTELTSWMDSVVLSANGFLSGSVDIVADAFNGTLNGVWNGSVLYSFTSDIIAMINNNKTVIDASIIANTTEAKAYSDANNDSMKVYVDNAGVVDTDSQKKGSDRYTFNDSDTIYWNDTVGNQSILDWITFHNDSIKSYVDSSELYNSSEEIRTQLNAGTNATYNPATGEIDCKFSQDTTIANTDTQDLSYDAGTDVISLVDGGSIDISEVDTDTTYVCSDWSACSDDSLWDADKLDGQDGSYYLDNTVNSSVEIRATVFGDEVNATDDLPMGGYNITYVDCIVGLGGGVLC